MATAETLSLEVRGMRCAGCVGQVERALLTVEGVAEASVNLATGQALVKGAVADLGLLESAVEKAGFQARVLSTASPAQRLAEIDAQNAREERTLRRNLTFSVFVTGMIFLLPWILPHNNSQIISLVLATLLQVIVGKPFYVGAWHRLRRFSADMDTLVAIGTTAALGYSIVWAFLHPHEHGYAHDSVMVLTLVTLGKWLEWRSRTDAGNAIRELLRLAPSQATRLIGDKLETIPAESIAVRDILLVRPGESFPVDGTIVDGVSTVDQSMLTGESMPIDKKAGDVVSAGTINGAGLLRVRAGRVGGDTALAGIIRLVDQAQSTKPRLARLADAVAAWFVPVVLLIALMTLVGQWIGNSGDVGLAIRAAVSVLVVACPCAMGLATPTAVMVATGLGARIGAFIRRAQALEEVGRVDTIILDKTGTVTQGRPKVVAIDPIAPWSEFDLLRLAAAAERTSQHPWAQAIVNEALRRSIELPLAESAQEIAGAGVAAQIDSRTVLVGKKSLLESREIPLASLAPAGIGAVVHVAVDQSHAGRLLLADELKPTSQAAIDQLTRLGIDVHMVTGDTEEVAKEIASRAGIPAHRVQASCTPAQKEEIVRALRSTGKHVAMVGDGINDAPALAAASAGIAMGYGTDIAKEAGDIVLANSDLLTLPRTLALCRATVRKIKQNLFWAFGYNALLLPLAAMGYLSPTWSAFAMAASSVSVVTNSLTLRLGWWDRQ
jgi:Cu+-exporting ATPase